MKKIDISNLLFHILLPIVFGSAVGFIFNDSSFLDSLEKTIEVPKIVFPIVWSILYILIGIWYHNYSKSADLKQKTLYYILLFLNFLFTPILFHFNNIVLALVVVLILLIGNVVLFKDFIKKSKIGYLLLPYILWLIFANVLMIDLFVNNVL